ncbi:MAG: hypothetical protein RSC24_06310 [Clostridium sp.]
MLKINNLEKCFKEAKKDGVEFVGVLISMDGFEKPEIIINGCENFDKKLEYYKGAYNEDLTLKAAPDKVKIIGFTMGDTFEEIENLLFG